MNGSRKPLHLCVPVLKRYDLLRLLFLSLYHSTVAPTKVVVIDNGTGGQPLANALNCCKWPLQLVAPTTPKGVAESWNYFLSFPDDRLIVNDDIMFGPESLARMQDSNGSFVSGLDGNAFSCFLLRDECIRQIREADRIRMTQYRLEHGRASGFDTHPGMFDEAISPGYAYFEDCDFEHRMYALGLRITHVDCGVQHLKSSTIQSFTKEETQSHHRKFITAQNNFIQKWGQLPRGIERQF